MMKKTLWLWHNRCSVVVSPNEPEFKECEHPVFNEVIGYFEWKKAKTYECSNGIHLCDKESKAFFGDIIPDLKKNPEACAEIEVSMKIKGLWTE